MVLFRVVVTLAAGLIGYVAWPMARARRLARQERAAKRARPPRLTPAVPGKSARLPPRLRSRPGVSPARRARADAANDPAARAAVPGTTCPTCRRSFDGLKKFCPFDGEELVPLTLAIGAPAFPRGVVGVLGKICPICSRRFESDATFCGRDGSELVVG